MDPHASVALGSSQFEPGGYGDGGSGFVGDIDEVRLYLLALSEDDVRSLHESPTSAGAIGKSAGLTCAHILAKDSAATSGVYRLEPDGAGVEPFDAYCDMVASDGTTGGGWTLVTTRDSGSATVELVEGAMEPDMRRSAVTATQWQYLKSKSSQLLIKMKGAVMASTVEGCSNCNFGEISMVVDTSSLSTYSCNSITSATSLTGTLLFRDRDCDDEGGAVRYTDILGVTADQVDDQTVIQFAGTAVLVFAFAIGLHIIIYTCTYKFRE